MNIMIDMYHALLWTRFHKTKRTEEELITYCIDHATGTYGMTSMQELAQSAKKAIQMIRYYHNIVVTEEQAKYSEIYDYMVEQGIHNGTPMTWPEYKMYYPFFDRKDYKGYLVRFLKKLKN